MQADSQNTDALIAAGRLFHQRGWVPASGGNFSFRQHDLIAITRSGVHKGELNPNDLMWVNDDGLAINVDQKSSAETGLHCQIYRDVANAQCVFHTHSIASTLLSMSQDVVELKGYELLKILDGVDTHEATVSIPVFENDQDIDRLSAQVSAAMKRGDARHGYLIRGHGLYAWADSIAVARYRIEALEFMFECERYRSK